MALTSCKECGKELSDFAKFCPHCGAPRLEAIGVEDPQRVTRIGWALVALGVALVGFEFYGIAEGFSQGSIIVPSVMLIALGLWFARLKARKK